MVYDYLNKEHDADPEKLIQYRYLSLNDLHMKVEVNGKDIKFSDDGVLSKCLVDGALKFFFLTRRGRRPR